MGRRRGRDIVGGMPHRLRPPALLLAIALAWPGCVPKSAIPGPGAEPNDDDTTAGDDDDTTAIQDDDDSTDCGYGDITPDPDGTLFGLVGLSADLQPQIDAGCDCHQVGNPSIQDLSPGKVWASWVEEPYPSDPDEILVLPGAPEESVVFWKLMDCFPLFPYSGAAMPPGGAGLSLEDLALFHNWILQGGLDN